MAMIALSCHFALHLGIKKRCIPLPDASSSTVVHGVFSKLWHHCHLGNIVNLSWVMLSLQFFVQHVRFLAEPFTVVRCYFSVVIGGFCDVPLRERFRYHDAASYR